ncbi:CHAD domain-containing protein, partial [Streptomyces sp. SID4917]|nr:CHAD domain-containing protein [Streptomyces sp. SID4917]
MYGESGSDTAAAEAAARTLRGAARRIGGGLHTYRPLLDPAWADQLRTELGWLSGTLAQEHACTSRLHRLLGALARLSGATAASSAAAVSVSSVSRTEDQPEGVPSGPGTLTVGASRAGALLDRQLTLARTRAHSAALQALGSSRFHAVADAVAVLASEVPLGPLAAAPAV